MRLAGEDYGVDELLVSNDTLAFGVRSELELGASYRAQFVGCGVELEAEVEAASGGRRLGEMRARDPGARAGRSGARADPVRGRDVPVRAAVRRGGDDRLAGRAAVCQQRRGAARLGGRRDGFVGGPRDSVRVYGAERGGEDGVGGHAARRSGAGRHAARAAERCDVHATGGEPLRSRLSGRAGRQHGSRRRSGSVQMSAKQRAVRVPVRKAGRVDGVLSVCSVRCLLNQQSRNRGINGK